MYTYQARTKRVIDGDTMEFIVDLGFGVTKEITVRVLDLDTWEVRGKDKRMGLAAKAAASHLLIPDGNPQPVLLRTRKDRHGDDAQGKFGRWLADIRLPDGSDFAERMRELGHEDTSGV